MRLIFLFILTLISFSCSSSNDESLKKVDNFEIVYSNSGGFTNFVSGKVFKSSGVVEYFTGSSNSSVKMVKNYTISTDQIKNISSLLFLIKLEELELNEKGNINYILKIKLNENEKTFSWRDQELSSNLPKEIKDLIIYLNSL